jgi:putative iron-regulated protein
MFFAMFLVYTSCDKVEPESEIVFKDRIVEVEVEKEVIVESLKVDVQETYANVVYKNYKDSYELALALQSAVNSFVAAPSANGFAVAKSAWFASREPYGQTEAFRFAGGPIDAEDGPEGLLNAWPLDESYIHYVYGSEMSGIVNDPETYPTLSKELLSSLNEAGGDANISIGYHAIEYLLWGQDLTKPSDKQRGLREFTDFTTQVNSDRRGEYLNISSELLIDHLNSMVMAWDPSVSGNFREEFLALSANDAITNILTGIGTLSKSELAGELIFTAYDNRDQEDEHSCFSDNTHRDTRLNAIGIRNVLTGCYIQKDGISKVTGASLIDLINLVDPAFGENISSQMNVALSAVNDTAIPFDFAIADDNERPKVLTAVQELRVLGDMIAALGTKLGLSVNTDGWFFK